MQVKRAVLARTYSVPNVGEGCRLENEQRTTRHVCYTHTVTDVCVITHFITRPHLGIQQYSLDSYESRHSSADLGSDSGSARVEFELPPMTPVDAVQNLHDRPRAPSRACTHITMHTHAIFYPLFRVE